MQPIPLLLLSLLAGGLGRTPAPSTPPTEPATPPAVTGEYVEGRSASVFAGACHYNSELVTQGREALLAWRFDAGEADGVPLAGVTAVVIVVGERNLDFADAPRESVLYLDRAAPPAAREAAATLLRARHARVLGRVKAVVPADVSLERDGDDYRVEVAGVAKLSGSLLPDRACCTMPLARWYEPFSDVGPSIVGENAEFRHEATRWIPHRWARFDENGAFAARFRWQVPAPAPAPERSSSEIAAVRGR